MAQALAERDVALAVVAEPYRVLDSPNWYGDLRGLVPVVWMGSSRNPSAELLHRGNGHVGIRWGDRCGGGMLRLAQLHTRAIRGLPGRGEKRGGPSLVRVSDRPRRLQRPRGSVGMPEDEREETLLDWAAGLDLRILNRGRASTCVRPMGESVVDITFATPAALKRLFAWRVDASLVLLSDQIPILMLYCAPGPARCPRGDDEEDDEEDARGSARKTRGRRGAIDPARRWQLQRMDENALLAAVHVADWPSSTAGDVEAQVAELQWAVSEACDVSMPRASKNGRLTVLCKRANRAHRRYTRARRRVGVTLEKEVAFRADYRRADKSLRRAIKRARAAKWNELLETLDQDPWGRPYRVVLGRMRGWATPLTESMEPAFAERVFDALIPGSPGVECQSEKAPRPATRCEVEWTDDLGVTTEELGRAIGRMGARSLDASGYSRRMSSEVASRTSSTSA
ncbi:uncharacterized protein LOC143220661 [Lasioglossum baleicum]|uniref:uncharacterized protein LOC143220661 n=1 Tax=Lasioglossum baleicum TaxID=434251 RepID=UPI003FCDE77C